MISLTEIQKQLPNEIKNEILLYIYKSCDICFKKIFYWNIYSLSDIYKIKMVNNDYRFVYIFLNSEKKICTHCYCMIKYWFRSV